MARERLERVILSVFMTISGDDVQGESAAGAVVACARAIEIAIVRLKISPISASCSPRSTDHNEIGDFATIFQSHHALIIHSRKPMLDY